MVETFADTHDIQALEQRQGIVSRTVARFLLWRERGNLEDNDPSDLGVLQSFEQDGFVREAPHLSAQVADESRTNTLVSGGKYTDIRVAEMGVSYSRKEMSEQNALQELSSFLDIARNSGGIIGDGNATLAENIQDNLAYIGKKEFKEAASGIADYWKAQLTRDKSLQLFVPVGGQRGIFQKNGQSQKSDGLLLDELLANFTDAELEGFAGRIVTDDDDIVENMKTKMVFLDDWSISGTQLRQAHSNLMYSNKKIDEYEVCLVVASKEMLDQGLHVHKQDDAIPVRSYFRARDPQVRASMGTATLLGNAYPGYISGTHSSVDFNFDRAIGGIVKAASESQLAGDEVPASLTEMPATTQIERSYAVSYQPKENIERLRKANGKP